MRSRDPARLVVLLALFSGALSAPEHDVRAQQMDSERIVACMLAKTTQDQKTIFKKLMIAALGEDKAAADEQIAAAVRFMRDLALNDCSMSQQLVGTQQYDEIGQIYAERLGETLAREALAKLK